MTKTSAMGAFEIHIFEPFSSNPPVTFFAFVVMEAGSEPEFASVSPKHPILSPDANFGRYFSFCFCDPNLDIGYITRDD